MALLAIMYGSMNILSFVALRNIGAGLFTVFAQLKILTTATFSAIILRRKYSMARWRALIGLMMGVLLFSEPIWNGADETDAVVGGQKVLGCTAVMIEVSLSGFASIYFEKVIKTDAEQMTIWERNFQLAMWSFPIYLGLILYEGGGEAALRRAPRTESRARRGGCDSLLHRRSERMPRDRDAAAPLGQLPRHGGV